MAHYSQPQTPLWVSLSIGFGVTLNCLLSLFCLGYLSGGAGFGFLILCLILAVPCGLGYFAYYAAYHPGLYLGLEEAYNAYQNVQLQHSLESSQKDGGVEVGLSSSNPNQVMPMRQAD